jgi:hypothetical protein
MAGKGLLRGRLLRRNQVGLGLLPLIGTAPAHAQHPAQVSNRPNAWLFADKQVLAHGCGCEKMVTAFFKLSRSVSTRFNSARKRLISSRSALPAAQQRGRDAGHGLRRIAARRPLPAGRTPL